VTHRTHFAASGSGLVHELVAGLPFAPQLPVLSEPNLSGSVRKTMACDKKLNLLFECSKAAQEFADAVRNLYAKTVVSTHKEYESLKRVVDDRHVVAEQALHAFDKHVSEHGC